MMNGPLSVINQGAEAIEEYWKTHVDQMRIKISEMEDSDGYVDPTLTSLLELMETALEIEQYKRPVSYYEPVSRLVRIRVNAPRSVVEKVFGLKTISVYGIGLFAVVDGLLLSSSFRNKSNYDRIGKKGVTYDLSDIPEDLKEEYEFGYSISAFEGIFVPKKQVLTSWISRSSQLQFFDISI